MTKDGIALTHQYLVRPSSTRQSYFTAICNKDGKLVQVYSSVDPTETLTSGLLAIFTVLINCMVAGGDDLQKALQVINAISITIDKMTKKHSEMMVAISAATEVHSFLHKKFLTEKGKAEVARQIQLNRERAGDAVKAPTPINDGTEPPCPTCGTIMVRQGIGHKCPHCGTTTGYV